MAFINLQRLLDLNPDAVQQMGQLAANAASPDIQNANKAVMQYGANPLGTVENPLERVAKAQAKAQMLGSTGGLTELIGSEMGKKGATGQRTSGLLDAFFAGQSGAVQGLQKQAAGMGQRYDAAGQSAQNLTNQYAQMAQAQKQAPVDQGQQYQAAYDSAKAAYNNLVHRGGYTSSQLAAAQQALNKAQSDLQAWRQSQA